MHCGGGSLAAGKRGAGGGKRSQLKSTGAAVFTDAETASLPCVTSLDAYAFPVCEVGWLAPPSAGTPQGPLPGLSSLCCETAEEEGRPL